MSLTNSSLPSRGSSSLQIAKALGCSVTVISRSRAKEEFAKRCGADKLVASSDAEDMALNGKTLDLIINTVPNYHDYFSYQPLLDKNSRIGKQVILGLHEGLVNGGVLSKLTFGRSRITASGIGGIKATQDVINLCSKHNILPEIEVVSCDKVSVRINEDAQAQQIVKTTRSISRASEANYNCSSLRSSFFRSTNGFHFHSLRPLFNFGCRRTGSTSNSINQMIAANVTS